MEGSRGKALKALTILKYLRLEIADSGLFYTPKLTSFHSKRKDFWLVERICYFKSGLSYPKKKVIRYFFSHYISLKKGKH